MIAVCIFCDCNICITLTFNVEFFILPINTIVQTLYLTDHGVEEFALGYINPICKWTQLKPTLSLGLNIFLQVVQSKPGPIHGYILGESQKIDGKIEQPPPFRIRW